MSTDRYLTVNQLSAKLNLSRATIYRLMDQGLPSVKVGNARRFPLSAVEVWLESQEVPTSDASRGQPLSQPEGVLLPGHYRCNNCGGVNRIVHPTLQRLLCCWQCGRGPLNVAAVAETG